MAKRHGVLFERIISMDNLRLAYHKARRGKSRMHNVRRFEEDVEGNLRSIRQSLVDGRFTTSSYQVKQIFEPKPREIFVLPFSPDRIVQHALMNVLESIWSSLFIHDSYACRRGYGPHAGSRRAMEFVRRYRYCLKADIRKFYPSVDHDILFAVVQRKIKCPGTLNLLRDIIYSSPGGKNVPIGNYTSQWLGNLYLNELDQWLKHRHRIKAYLRYCDDFCLFSDDKTYLRKMKELIRLFIDEKLLLQYSKAEVFPVSQGVDFLGYRHFPTHILVRKSTAKRIQRRLRGLPLALAQGDITLEQFRGCVASAHGWLKHANSHNLAVALQLERLLEGSRG
jgi:retron-type reverse transcriptase